MRIRNYKYKIRMNARFRTLCEATLEGCRDLHNAALQQRRDAYRQQGKFVSWVDQSRQLTEAREMPEVGAILRSFQSHVLKKLDRAFAAFFRQVKRGERPGYPRFKGFDRYNSFTTADWREFNVEGDRLKIHKLGSARLRLSRPLGGRAKQITIKREHDGWYAILSCECEDVNALAATGLSVGIDVGLKAFATLSTGEIIDNPRYFRRSESGLAEARRGLSLKKRGSLSRERAKRIVQSCYAKIKRQRDWFHWHEARKLVARFDRIAVEDLNVRGLARSNLAKSIYDAGWSTWINKLIVKAEDAGRAVIRVNANHTSQDCSKCGRREKKELSERWHSCPCGAELSRDHNAAINILARAVPVTERKQIYA